MSNKLRFSLVFSFAAAMFAFTGCELEPGQGCDTNDPNCGQVTTGTDTRTTGNDTNVTGTDTNTGTGCTLAAGCLDYKFIRVDDQSSSGGDNPGADIDAVVLVKGSQRIFANTAPQYAAADLVEASDSNEALGAPDAFESYPNDTSQCGLYKSQSDCEDNGICDPTYVSLGGSGGYLIVGVPEAIERGDQIQVLEVGNCEFPSADNPGTFGNAPAEEINIQVSVSDDPNGSWVVVAENGTGPVISATVPSLPEVPAN